MRRRTLLVILSVALWGRLESVQVIAATAPVERSPYCGDSTCQTETCDPQLPYPSGNGCEENQDNCSDDCGVCGDDICQGAIEDYYSCYQDCPLSEGYFPAGYEDIYYPADYAAPTYGVDWRALTEPQPNWVDDCFGNCGAGCGTFFNPCGGDPQYWVLTIDEEPEYVEGDGNFCMDGDVYSGHFDGYLAPITWTYFGWAAVGCFGHDATCPEYTWLGCLLYFGCGDEWRETWDYSYTLAWGGSLTNVQYLYSGAGICDGPESPGPVIR